MSFDLPGALILLTALPLLLILHLLLRRLRRREISSLLLWERILKKRRRSLASPRILNSLSVLLQAAAIVLIALAAAQPILQFKSRGLEGGTLFAIDLSASMAARSGESTRLAEAKNLALAEISGARPPYILAAIEEAPRIILQRSRSAVELTREIRRLSPRAIEADTGKATEELLASLGMNGRREIRIYTDRPRPEELSPARNLSWHQIGQAEANRALLALNAVPGDQDFIVQAVVANFSELPARFNLQLSAEDTPLEPRRLELDAGQQREILFRIPASHRYIAARLDGSDSLALDDQAELYLRPDPLRVEMIGVPDPFLAAALGALERGGLIARTERAALALRPPNLRIVTAPPAEETENLFIPSIRFGVYPTMAGIQKAGTVESAAAFSLLESYAPSLFRVARADVLSLPPLATPLYAAGSIPLISRLETGAGHILFHFRLTDSDLPLREEFPLLLAQAVQELSGRTQDLRIFRARLPGAAESDLRTAYSSQVEAPEKIRVVAGQERSFRLLRLLAALAAVCLVAEATLQARRWKE